MSSTEWPSGSQNNSWPEEPKSLLPGNVQKWPTGTQRAANEAEQLLSQAVAWWDVSQYRDGDRFLRNRGTGGELLDLRLGSSIAANSNDPQYLAPENQGYVYLPGSSTTDRLNVAHESAMNTTDLDVRVLVAMDDWTPTSTLGFASRTGADPNRSFTWTLLTTGRFRLIWFPTGSAASGITVDSTAAPTAADGNALWVRVTLDVDNGSGKYEVRFYTSPAQDGTNWTQLGDAVVGGTTTNLPTVTTEFAASNGAGIAGKLYRVQMMDSIGGTPVVDIDCDVITTGSATSFTAATGQTVTVSRSATGRKSVAVPSRHKGGKPVMLLGTDDYLEVQDNWQHGLLNFGQGDSFTVLFVARDWAVDNATYYYLVKRALTPSTYPGWMMYRFGNATVAQVYDSNNVTYSSGASAGAISAGTPFVATHVRDTIKRTGTSYLGATAGTSQRDNSGAGFVTQARLQIGQYSVGGFAAVEFYGAAIFRRALSAAEITTLSNYFTGRIS